MAEQKDDPRFEEIQREIDETRARLPKDPGLGVPDPDIVPWRTRTSPTRPSDPLPLPV